MTAPKKQVRLAAHFPGVNHTTVWSDARSRSQIEFESFAYLAKRAEQGLFDFFFLAEGLRLRELRGQIFDLDVVGRPDSLTVLAGLAAVTERIGLAATLNTTFNEPYELARQFATLDHLSGGRAAWNAVTSPDAFTGENFRRGGYLPHSERYSRAAEFIEAANAIWSSWAPDAVLADQQSGEFLRPGAISRFHHEGPQFSIAGRLATPPGPQGRPVQIQAGDSEGGRELAAKHADVIFSRHSTYDAGRAFYADVKGRLGAYGRARDELLIIPAATVVIADTNAEAHELAREIQYQQISPQGAIAFLEQIWGRDLSEYDPDGPLPQIDPDPEGFDEISRGRVRHTDDPIGLAKQWRELAEAEHLSIRDLIVKVYGRSSFIGTASEVAEAIDRNVQADAADGYIFVPHITPTGLDDFIDKVVPELQERGVFRTRYEHETLRDNLGLPPVQAGSEAALSGATR